MKVGGSSSNLLQCILTDEEKKKLKLMIKKEVPDGFTSEIEECFRILNLGHIDRNTASWKEVRPELEKLINAAEKFSDYIRPFASARLGTPRAAASYVANDTVAEWIGHPIVAAHNEAPSVHELSEIVDIFVMRAKKNMEDKVAEAKGEGRPGDTSFAALIVNIDAVTSRQGLRFGVSTDAKSGDLFSPFWSFVIEVTGRIRGMPNAGSNSEQAALQFIKRVLRDENRRLRS